MAGLDHTASLDNLLQIMDSVARGSEVQTMLSARVLFRVLRSVAASPFSSSLPPHHISSDSRLARHLML